MVMAKGMPRRGEVTTLQGRVSSFSSSSRAQGAYSDTAVVEEIWENEQHVPLRGWGALMQGRTYENVDGSEYYAQLILPLPNGWKWGDEWTVDHEWHPESDEEGWVYGKSLALIREMSLRRSTSSVPVVLPSSRRNSSSWGAVRRRRWIRTRCLANARVKRALTERRIDMQTELDVRERVLSAQRASFDELSIFERDRRSAVQDFRGRMKHELKVLSDCACCGANAVVDLLVFVKGCVKVTQAHGAALSSFVEGRKRSNATRLGDLSGPGGLRNHTRELSSSSLHSESGSGGVPYTPFRGPWGEAVLTILDGQAADSVSFCASLSERTERDASSLAADFESVLTDLRGNISELWVKVKNQEHAQQRAFAAMEKAHRFASLEAVDVLHCLAESLKLADSGVQQCRPPSTSSTSLWQLHEEYASQHRLGVRLQKELAEAQSASRSKVSMLERRRLTLQSETASSLARALSQHSSKVAAMWMTHLPSADPFEGPVAPVVPRLPSPQPTLLGSDGPSDEVSASHSQNKAVPAGDGTGIPLLDPPSCAMTRKEAIMKYTDCSCDDDGETSRVRKVNCVLTWDRYLHIYPLDGADPMGKAFDGLKRYRTDDLHVVVTIGDVRQLEVSAIAAPDFLPRMHARSQSQGSVLQKSNSSRRLARTSSGDVAAMLHSAGTPKVSLSSMAEITKGAVFTLQPDSDEEVNAWKRAIENPWSEGWSEEASNYSLESSDLGGSTVSCEGHQRILFHL